MIHYIGDSAVTIPDEALEAAYQSVMDERDAAPRVPNDADSYCVAIAAVSAASTLIAAAALEDLLTDSIATDRGLSQYPNMPPYSAGREEEAMAWIRTVRHRANNLRLSVAFRDESSGGGV